MKRSRSVTLLLLGSAGAGLLTSCQPQEETRITEQSAFENNHFIPGAGYFHAPYRAFFPLPYNKLDTASGRYYAGGVWRDVQETNVIHVATPTREAALVAQAARESHITREGFGYHGRYHSTFS